MGPRRRRAHQAAHSCGHGDEGCVNPSHLRWATPQENSDDMVLHGTQACGEKNGWSKLTASQVREIRGLKGEMPQRAVAERFGTSQSNVSLIHLGRAWSHLPDESEKNQVPYLQDMPL